MTDGNGPLPPGSTIGILGGGQLGRMTALAAARLGYRCHVFTPEGDGPATHVAAACTIAEYENTAALDAFAAAVDVVTYEFENVPATTVERLNQRRPVRPGPLALTVAQDRGREKRFLSEEAGVPVVPFAEIASPKALEAALETIGTPAVLKTARLGYDGKGQVAIADPADAADAYVRMGARRGVLEAWVDFAMEISVVLARGGDGTTASYVPVANVHREHILDVTTAPASIPPVLAEKATAIATAVAQKLEVVGVLAVEMFVTRDGRLLVNEIAPRPHNSGHWTIDACAVSQFEQFVRAICGLPLGDPARHSDAVMTNLIGEDAHRWAALMAERGACIHLYGKHEARPRRKMGHVTRLHPLGSLAAR